MIIMKFGGSSLADADRIRNVVNIVKLNVEKRPVVIVSALAGVTDSLLNAANLALQGKEAAEISRIEKKHTDAMRSLGIKEDGVRKDMEELTRLMGSISLLGELTPKTLDSAVSFGERMSSKIVAAYMRKVGIRAKAYNAYEAGLLTDSNFGYADVSPADYPLIAKALKNTRGRIPVITGYIGMDGQGNITTLGRGGSDYTASIFGAALDADEIQIWTDVDGIMTADPRIVKSALSIGEVSNQEASELAFLGAKVLHPKTILPAIKKNIPVHILNTFNPKHRGTMVMRDIRIKSRVASIACKKRIKVLNIYSTKMFLAHGFLREVFAILDNFGFLVDMVATSEVNVSITIDGSRDTRALVRSLGEIGAVEVMEGRAKVSLVGKNMVLIPGVFGKTFPSLGDMRIEMSSSISEINQSFVVRERDADAAVRLLHKTFFGR
jgi:aspartate kinase